MPFVELKNIEGKIYIPECNEECKKKHDCKDCYFCQFCSDQRCKVCLNKNERS